MKIHIENRQKKVKLDRRYIRSIINRLGNILKCADKEISLLFIDNEQIREMNRQYLGRDYPTNVISFPLQEGDFCEINPRILGDIVISAERALQDAAVGDLTFEDEIDFLMIHGLLHLLGYDHENGNESDAITMKDKEDDLFFVLHGYEIVHS